MKYLVATIAMLATLAYGANDIVVSVGRPGAATVSYKFAGGNNLVADFSTANPLASCDVLIVAGGGGGGYNVGGGGGGGGTIYTNISMVSTATVIIGVAGVGAIMDTVGGNGGDSAVGTTITYGGGGGGTYNDGTTILDGGSGGGSGMPTFYGAATNGQGNVGGSGMNGESSAYNGGGGGGAAFAGTDGTYVSGNSLGGNGGTGLVCNISGASQTYGSGGGGASGGLGSGTDANYGIGGTGAGIGAIDDNSVRLRDGTAATYYGCGGGGGGWSSHAPVGGYNGYQGIVIIRYAAPAHLATGGAITTNGSYIIHTYDTSGTNSFIPD